jgi:uncharacterized protein
MSATINIEVISAQNNDVQRVTLALPAGSTVNDALIGVDFAQTALAASRIVSETEHVADSYIGIWGRRVTLSTVLDDRDRIELYRPVIADAKSARLKRASEQGYRWQGRTRRAATK